MKSKPFLVGGLALWLVTTSAGASLAQEAPSRVLLRLASDSGVVGHYRFQASERSRLVFDIPDDDPRVALLREATTPRQRDTEIGATIVSVPRDEEEDRRYLVYWLAFQTTGGDTPGLTPLQWDSIFRKTGRRASLDLSPRGAVQSVQVVSAAVRPVGQAFARMLGGLALRVPADSVGAGSSWQSMVAIPVNRPDGSPAQVSVRVTHRLRELRSEAGGLKARIEFDGDAVSSGAGEPEVSGRYYGESVFAVAEGRYERVLALANLEVRWSETGGLPPSRTLLEWRGEATRR